MTPELWGQLLVAVVVAVLGGAAGGYVTLQLLLYRVERLEQWQAEMQTWKEETIPRLANRRGH